MKTNSKTNGPARVRAADRTLFIAACVCSQFLIAPAMAGGQECQNQAKIDACKLGCTVTGDVCGALCGAAVDVCTGVCIGGCATTCAIDCCAGFCPDSDACRRCIGNCEDDCEEGCQLECDDCIFDCEQDCESICRPFKKIGESCAPLVDRCADGLTCWPFLFQCFPSENDELYSDDDCRSFYSGGVHQGAIDGNVAWTFGTGGASAVGVSETLETGNVYGPDGRYGCYFTICLGGTSDVEVGLYAATGIYISYDDFKGESVAFVEEAGEGVVFATSQIINTSGELIGTADALSLELSLLPVAVGVYDCTTIVDTVGIRQPDGSLLPIDNSPPTAICEDQVACADPLQCTADVSIDDGSIDPDNDPLVLTQDPAGPYGVGIRDVTLTVSDLEGLFDTCMGTVQVDDCTEPEILCPKSMVVDCEGDGETFLDPGDAVVLDCSEVTIMDHEPQAFPLGETTLTYSAEDAVGLSSSCEQTITVVSDDTDGDGLVDCLDDCPFVRANSPTGCGSALPEDADGDGVPNDLDACPGTEAGVTVDASGCPVEEPPTQPLPDSDGDGVPDDLDLCTDTPMDEEVDEDGCPIAPPVVDTDGDGVTDDVDLCPATPDGVEVDGDGCPVDEPPTQPTPDGDGVPDDVDLCADTPADVEVDEDGCSTEDDDPGQPLPDNDGIVQTPCGPIDLSALFMMILGFNGLRLISVRRWRPGPCAR